MKKVIVLLLVQLFLFSFAETQAQSKSFKVMQRPDIYDTPLDKAGFSTSSYKGYSNEVWIVYADRDGAYTLEDLKKKEKLKDLKFKDWFYVIEDNDKWLHLAKASQSNQKGTKITNAEDYGWIEKDKMLLWSTGLLDQKTLINKKAFLLNKARDVKRILQQEKKEDVAIYTDPLGRESIGKKTIYEFYFVYKEEGSYMLVGKNVNLSSRTIKENLVGWVRTSKAVSWDTRIAMEPNFDQAAFDERKSANDLRLIAYGTQVNADKHAKEGKAPDARDDMIWTDDPVTRPKMEMARTNPNRWPGAVVRLPMLTNFGDYYMTGIVGDITTNTISNIRDTISEVSYANIEGQMNVKSDKRHNYNIFFVIEGTASMAPYKDIIAQAIDEMYGSLNSVEKVRIGAAIYRDVEEKKEGKLFEIQPLTTDGNEVLNFVSKAQFTKWHDNDEYTALNYGLNRALLEGGFNTNHTNIIYLIGNNADYRVNTLRRKTAKESNDETYVDKNKITDKLSELDAHIISFQLQNNDDLSSNRFNSESRKLIQQNASKQYDYYADICEELKEVPCINPVIPELEGPKTDLQNGATKQRLIKPNAGEKFSSGDIKNEIVQAARDINEYVEAYFDLTNAIVNEGNSFTTAMSSTGASVSAGELGPAFAKELKRLRDRKSGEWKQEDIQKLVDEKYQLYTEVFVPAKISGAKYRAFSYVLYMPEDDLNRYIRILEDVVNCADCAEDEKREVVQDALIELIDQFTGGSAVAKSGKISIEELKSLMQGVTDEGLSLGGGEADFLISDIRNERKVTKQELEDFVSRINKVVNNLKKISKTKNYEFSYKSGEDVYYWIPVEDTF